MDDNPVEVERPDLKAPLEKARGSKHPSAKHSVSTAGLRTLAIDVGGTHLKAVLLGPSGKMIADEVVIDTPHPCPPKTFLKSVDRLIRDLTSFDRVSVGFPGFVRRGTIVTAPHLGTKPWQDFALADVLAERLEKPVRVLNDADVQGFGLIRGRGLEMVLTLGTGAGTALFREGDLMPATRHFIAKVRSNGAAGYTRPSRSSGLSCTTIFSTSAAAMLPRSSIRRLM
jgi:hypothetical protein